MKFFWMGTIILALGLSACNSPKSKPHGDAPAALAGNGPGMAENAIVPTYNLGDVDFSTVPSLLLSEKSKSPSIEYNEQKTLRGHVAIANATVRSPRPANLLIRALIESSLGYPATDSVYVKMMVMADTRKDPLVTKTWVFSGKTLALRPESEEVDLMPFLDPSVKSVLVQSKIEIIWFKNTPPSEIHVDAIDPSKGQKLEKLSNPLRIDFK